MPVFPAWLVQILANLAAEGLEEVAAEVRRWWQAGGRGPMPTAARGTSGRKAWELEEDPYLAECLYDRECDEHETRVRVIWEEE